MDELPAEFDGFRVVRKLGSGGMGVVYLADDVLLERRVALKLLLRAPGDQRSAGRLLTEARAIARLSHPNVPAVYRVGEVGGRPYLACELVEGRSLDQVALPLPWRQVLAVGLGVSRALAAALGRGVLHRDVKPANVVLSERGEVKLLDFGVAKLAGEPEAAPAAAPPPLPDRGREAHTELIGATDGEIFGTPRYLAPEVWRGLAASPASDVYALGVMLRELLTGEAAGAPPSDAPPALMAIIARCAAAEPDDRYATAAEARDALEALGGAPAPVPLEPPRTQFAKNGRVALAYQVIGSGPFDLVFVPGFISHVEVAWEEPSFAAFLRRLASFSRLILLDKRGTGLSDRVEISSVADRMDDLRAVMDAAGSERASIFGMSEGAVLASLFAATHPERTRSLVIYGCGACGTRRPDYPEGPDPALYEAAFSAFQEHWGEPLFLEFEAPDRVGDEAFARWWARYLRQGASPATATALLKANAELDIRHALPAIRCPTLCLSRGDDPVAPTAALRHMAAGIRGARHVELPGHGHLPFTGDAEAFLAAMEAFLAGAQPATSEGGSLVSLLVVRAAARADFQREIARHDGVELADTRATLAAVFAHAGQAVRCARALVAAQPGASAVVVAGADSGVGLLAEGEELAARARPGEVLVAPLVRELAAGASLDFAARDDGAVFVARG